LVEKRVFDLTGIFLCDMRINARGPAFTVLWLERCSIEQYFLANDG
jgi:hypothetical protein